MAVEFQLYWVTDAEDSENWLIFARGEREAREYYRDHEGFRTIRDIQAELVVETVRLKRPDVKSSLATHKFLTSDNLGSRSSAPIRINGSFAIMEGHS
jgi:hypothetical protein